MFPGGWLLLAPHSPPPPLHDVGIYEQQQMQLPASISNYMAATKRNNIMAAPGERREVSRIASHRCLLPSACSLLHKF